MLHVLLPLFITVPAVVIFVILRKIYWRFHPKIIPVQQSDSTPTKQSTSGDKLPLKTSFTNFELATGSQLELMYGMLSDFDNFIIIKGMRFASADGVYGAGFLIVNRKSLVQANDIWPILLMKLIRVRCTSVYIFLLDRTIVQKRAQLVYPDTITMHDLLHLSSSTLS